MPGKLTATARWVEGLQFVGESGTGHAVVMDATPDKGGRATGPKPMELLLVALGGCTGMDMASLLRKMRVDYSNIEVNVTGNWVDKDDYPYWFETIEVEYVVTGRDVPEEQVRKAIGLSEGKYCNVSQNLKGVSKITTSYKIVNI